MDWTGILTTESDRNITFYPKCYVTTGERDSIEHRKSSDWKKLILVYTPLS